MNNIFENAYFGKPYKTRDGKRAIYHGSNKHESSDGKVWIYHYLMIEPVTIDFFGNDVTINHYSAYINDNGIGRFANLKYYKDSGASAKYDIISEWQEEIDEEELNKRAEKFCDKEYENPTDVNKAQNGLELGYSNLLNCYKAGYREAKSE